MPAIDGQNSVETAPSLETLLQAERVMRELERQYATAHEQARQAAIARRDDAPDEVVTGAVNKALDYLRAVEDQIRDFRGLVGAPQ